MVEHHAHIGGGFRIPLGNVPMETGIVKQSRKVRHVAHIPQAHIPLEVFHMLERVAQACGLAKVRDSSMRGDLHPPKPRKCFRQFQKFILPPLLHDRGFARLGYRWGKAHATKITTIDRNGHGVALFLVA